VLAVRGKLGSIRNPEIDLRLDSCADITLISEEVYNKLLDKPKLQQGKQMNLWQLTDKDCTIKGYIRIPVLVESREGVLLEFEAEAYVVPRMTVPILLGEDFQTTYELAVQRSVTEGTTVSIQSTDFEIPAVAANRTEDFARLRQSAYQLASFRRSAIHRRAKARRARQKKAAARDQNAIRAVQDERIKAGECRRIQVKGQFGEEKEWYFEREILPQTNNHCLVIPNVLMDASQPYLPVANTSNSPRMIRKGEILGYLQDPETTFDTPSGEEQYNEFKARAEAYSSIIADQAGWGAEDPKMPESEETERNDIQQSECDDDDVGPKTAALPDPTIYPSDKMKELLDVGDLPEHLQERAWEMLQSHVQAFGFDGRLGHYPGKVEIRTKQDQRPISLPMYGSSPEKRRVIDEQLDRWFELGVVEASRSPWSAPIVIAYRNGKLRFCVDSAL
jgi:hypothetical protein